MKIHVVTIFPAVVNALAGYSILKRAGEKRLVTVEAVDLREFTNDRHRSVDDAPYGGGAGMVMKPEPLFRAVEHLSAAGPADEIVALSPGGVPFSQKIAVQLAACRHLVVICGHYEGIDQRVLDNLVTMELSIGDYVLTGGELPAMVVVDAVTRLVPGVLGNQASVEEESFADGLLEHPQYTRPANFRGMEVPPVLLSGNHQEIARWRREKALEKTRARRPDLLKEQL